MSNSLLSALFETEERQPWSVSQLNSEVRAALDSRFASVWVEGEITNFHAHGSGHWYFSLTDGESYIRAACFRGSNYRIRFKPTNGLAVRVRGKVTIYGARGELQIVVESLEPVGEGALALAFEQIKAKLLGEGLFDPARKRPIPPHPRRVGVVTSQTGAALKDILTVLKRRARSVDVVVIPTLVQGETAGEQIARAVRLANDYCNGCVEEEKLDVLIVGRGGGSAEDLWAFNEEQVARAICASDIPVISAVGHEIDFTIADMAADLRAATPSAAAEIVARAESEVIEYLRRSTAELTRSVNMRLLSSRADVQSMAMAPVFAGFPRRLVEFGYTVDELVGRAEDAVEETIHERDESLRGLRMRLSPVGLAQRIGSIRKRLAVLHQRAGAAGEDLTLGRRGRLETVMASLDAMSPLKVLERGYSITHSIDGRILRSSEGVAEGDRLRIRLSRGELGAIVMEVSEP